MAVCEYTLTLLCSLIDPEETEEMGEVKYKSYMEEDEIFIDKIKIFFYQQIILSAIFYYLQRYEKDKEFLHPSSWGKIVSVLLNPK